MSILPTLKKSLLAGLTALAVTATASAQDSFKVGFVYVSPIGDAGWTYQHDLARKHLEETFEGLETVYVENVPEGADAQRVIRQLASGGSDLIFTTSFGYMNPTLQVARQFPKVVFEHATGYKRADNVGTYMPRLYEGRYLAGMTAGLMTETNKLGFVGAFPIPEVIRAVNAFTRGARAVNPDVEVSVVWINAWYDPSKARAAAGTLMDQGADVLTHHSDSHAVVQAAAERGKYAIAYHSDMAKYGKDYQLTAVVHKWDDYYEQVVREVMDGTWKSGNVWGGIDHGMVDLAPFGKAVPEEVREQVMAAREQIISGELHPFAGPVVDQSGTERVAEGETMSDEDMLKMDYYVEGITSRLPRS